MRILCRSHSESETEAIGESLAAALLPNGVLLLSGDLGLGKTVLTRGLARGLGIDEAEVQSPTFTLIREHRGERADLTHVDLYRLAGPEIEALGLWELLAGPGVKAVEWSERLTFEVPDAVHVTLRSAGPDRPREIAIVAPDAKEERLEALREFSTPPD